MVVAQIKDETGVIPKARAFTSGARDPACSCTIAWNQGVSAPRQILRKLRMTSSMGSRTLKLSHCRISRAFPNLR
jgi:hypothetical protein